MDSAKRTNDIVTALFPTEVRSRLYEQQQQNEENDQRRPKDAVYESSEEMNFFHVFLNQQGRANDDRSNKLFGGEPIADLFPNVTVMYLDIAGFTRWSSNREPTQVFRLLERIYHGFDTHAKQLGVFKVETIGDCYVAAVGLPQARSDHAVVM